MKKIVLAFVVSLLIHILLFLNYSFKESSKEETKKDNEKSEVKFVKLVQEKVLVKSQIFYQIVEKRLNKLSTAIFKNPLNYVIKLHTANGLVHLTNTIVL